MSYGSAIITVSEPYSDDGDHGFVKLEQGAIEPYVNYLTKAQAVGWLQTFMFGFPPPPTNCSGGNLNVLIYAYPSRPGLGFRLGTSNGTLLSRGVEPYEKTEIRQTEFEVEMASGTLPGETVSAIWQGDTYRPDGSLIIAPPPSLVDSSFIFPIPAYGALVITRRGFRHVYALSITPDPTPDENSLDAVVYAVWPGGVNGLEITVPDGVEDDVCNNRSGTDYRGDDLVDGDEDDDDPGYVEPEDTDCPINYCTEVMPGSPNAERYGHTPCDE